MHIPFHPVQGNHVGMLPQPAISQLSAQIFGAKSQYHAIGTATSTAAGSTDILQVQMFSKHVPVEPFVSVRPYIFAFAAAHG